MPDAPLVTTCILLKRTRRYLQCNVYGQTSTSARRSKSALPSAGAVVFPLWSSDVARNKSEQDLQNQETSRQRDRKRSVHDDGTLQACFRPDADRVGVLLEEFVRDCIHRQNINSEGISTPAGRAQWHNFNHLAALSLEHRPKSTHDSTATHEPANRTLKPQ